MVRQVPEIAKIMMAAKTNTPGHDGEGEKIWTLDEIMATLREIWNGMALMTENEALALFDDADDE